MPRVARPTYRNGMDYDQYKRDVNQWNILQAQEEIAKNQAKLLEAQEKSNKLNREQFEYAKRLNYKSNADADTELAQAVGIMVFLGIGFLLFGAFYFLCEHILPNL